MSDPSGHDPHFCDGTADAAACYDSHMAAITKRPNVRVYYLNAIGLEDRGVIAPNANLGDEQGYIIYRLGTVVGRGNVVHIPVYESDVNSTRGTMLGEMLEARVESPSVAARIQGDLQQHPLGSGERIAIVGNSGGGTLAVESLDQLQSAGISVDQVILRGSPIQESPLVNVNRVDYITADKILGVIPTDHYYSHDSNPFDAVQVNEYTVPGFYGHVMEDPQVRQTVTNMIVSLLVSR